MPEHVNITDPQIHEPRGASSAAENQLLVADGTGGTTWKNPSGIFASADFKIETILSSSSSATSQPVSANDTPVQLEFGPAINDVNDPVQLFVDGTARVNQTGTYIFLIEVNIGKPAGGTGVSRFFLRPLINAVPTDFVTAEYVNAGATTKHTLNTTIDLQAGDLLTYEYYRDSGGDSSGGVVQAVTTLADWTDVPTTSVIVKRFIPK